jgi:hypothetical protein
MVSRSAAAAVLLCGVLAVRARGRAAARCARSNTAARSADDRAPCAARCALRHLVGRRARARGSRARLRRGRERASACRRRCERARGAGPPPPARTSGCVGWKHPPVRALVRALRAPRRHLSGREGLRRLRHKRAAACPARGRACAAGCNAGMAAVPRTRRLRRRAPPPATTRRLRRTALPRLDARAAARPSH